MMKETPCLRHSSFSSCCSPSSPGEGGWEGAGEEGRGGEGLPRQIHALRAGGQRDRLRQMAPFEPDDLLGFELAPQLLYRRVQLEDGRDVFGCSPPLRRGGVRPVEAPDEERHVDRLEIA